MSVIIEGMTMPESCLYCPIKKWEEEWFKNIYYRCPLINRTMKLKEKELKNGRLEDCLLREIKEKESISKEKQIQKYIKKNFEPVEGKSEYVWFNKRNFEIISIETLTKSLKEKNITEFEKLKAEIKDNYTTDVAEDIIWLIDEHINELKGESND